VGYPPALRECLSCQKKSACRRPYYMEMGGNTFNRGE